MPNSKLKVISNAKHIPHLENENEFIIEIKEFLTNLGAI
jgi:pimeloyl-ACP methyl ester carboxylesterase